MRPLLGSLVGLVLCVGTAAAQAPTWSVRSAQGFAMDAKVVNGVWAEPGMMYSRPNLTPQGARYADDVDQFVTGPRISYGLGKLEAGFAIPYVRSLRDNDKDRDGFGDVSLYAKVVPIQNEMFAGGFGMVLITPSGDDDHELGYGEVGFEPFGTVALRLTQNGPFEARGSGGYRFFADDHKTPAGRVPPDAFFYRAGLFMAASERMGLRCEFAGEDIDIHGHREPMQIEPGIDIRIPTSLVEILVRPTGLVGLNNDAPDWGVGVGFAVVYSGGWPGQKTKKTPGLPF